MGVVYASSLLGLCYPPSSFASDVSSPFYNGWAFVEDNLDAPIWTTTYPWVIPLELFQGNYSSLFRQESFHGKKVMVASFHPFAITSARFQVIVMIALWERFKK
jgi:hypothetical protein